MAETFSDILDRPSNQAERPKPLPAGTYLCVLNGLPVHGKSAKKGTKFVEFTLNVMQAAEDVDQEALEEMGGLANKTLKGTYYLTDNSEYRLREFLTHCGIPEQEDGKDLSHRERIDRSPGCQVLAHVKHTASEDGQSVYANIDSTAAVE